MMTQIKIIVAAIVFLLILFAISGIGILTIESFIVLLVILICSIVAITRLDN